jgi:hypothetical protein
MLAHELVQVRVTMYVQLQIHLTIHGYIYILTGDPLAIPSVNADTDRRVTCLQGHRTWENSLDCLIWQIR